MMNFVSSRNKTKKRVLEVLHLWLYFYLYFTTYLDVYAHSFRFS